MENLLGHTHGILNRRFIWIPFLPTKIKVTLTRGSSVQPQLITSAEKDNNNKGNLIEVDSEPFL